MPSAPRSAGGRVRLATRAVVALAFALALLARPAAAAAGTRGAAPREVAPIEFRSERVKLAIDGDSLTVDGTYRFRVAPGGPRVPIFYPFPREARLGDARMVSLAARAASGAWQPLAWREAPAGSGVTWLLPDGLGAAPEVRAVYRQGLRGRWARYIVTTTAAWGRPLDRARFEVTLPEGARPRDATLALHAERIGGRRVWVHEARRFAPERDVDVAW